MRIIKIISFLFTLITLFTQGCGSGSSGNQDIYAGNFAPPESPYPIGYYLHETPPEGFRAVVGWMQAIDIDGDGEPCQVEVDWMRVYGVINGENIILLEDDFNAYLPTMDFYGLYRRDPWFAGDQLGDMPFVIQDSMLVLTPDVHPDKVFHWWNTKRSLVPEDADRVWFEAMVRISGGTGVQAGMDYWKDLSAPYAGVNINNVEAGASDWYGNSTDDWQIISVGRP